MSDKRFWRETVVTFFVCTACIGMAMGAVGVIFAPTQRFGYEAYFFPPVFGLLSTLLGVVTFSRKELRPGQVLARKAVYLLLVEAMIFAINYWNGGFIKAAAAWAVAASVLVVFVAVNLVLWLNDSRSAKEFNRALEQFHQIEKP